jgi:hypothetical protein
MIRRFSHLSALLAAMLAFGCGGGTRNQRDNELAFYGDEFSEYYQRPREESNRKRIDSKEIVAWATSPKDKKRIGFWETWEIRLKGSRQTRECHYIRDAGGLKDIGFVTAEGKFYKFGPKGELVYLNEYQIETIGLKVFFGLPASYNLDLEEIDPYK